MEKDWLGTLLQPMADDPAVGICASQLIIDATGKLDSGGDGLTTWGVGFKRGHEMDPELYVTQEQVFGASAAACLYRKTMLEEIGFFGFLISSLMTKIQISIFRANLGGWKCIYVPKGDRPS